MDEFLEDDAADSKRHMITGDLKPVSTGLCWEDVKGVFKSSTEESPVDLDSMKIDFFIRKFSVTSFGRVILTLYSSH